MLFNLGKTDNEKITLSAFFTPPLFDVANIDERDVLQQMTDGLAGTLIGDKNYIRPCLHFEALVEI